MKYALIVLLLIPNLVLGKDTPQLMDILNSAREHFPTIQAAVQERLIREGRLESALGAFDLA